MFGWVISILWTILKNNPNMILSKKTLCQALRKSNPLFLLFFYIVKRGYFNMFSDTARWHEKVLELFFFLKVGSLGEKSYLFFLVIHCFHLSWYVTCVYQCKIILSLRKHNLLLLKHNICEQSQNNYAFTNLHHLFPHKSTLNLRGWGVMNIY